MKHEGTFVFRRIHCATLAQPISKIRLQPVLYHVRVPSHLKVIFFALNKLAIALLRSNVWTVLVVGFLGLMVALMR